MTQVPESATITNVQMVQNFLTTYYQFKYNSNTNRLLVKSKFGTDDFHYLTDFEFNTILKNIKIANMFQGLVESCAVLRLCKQV